MVVTTRFNTEVLVRNGEMGDQNGVIYFSPLAEQDICPSARRGLC